jgi:hypothetical protein
MPWKNGKIEPQWATLQAVKQDLQGLADVDARDAKRSRARSEASRVTVQGRNLRRDRATPVDQHARHGVDGRMTVRRFLDRYALTYGCPLAAVVKPDPR